MVGKNIIKDTEQSDRREFVKWMDDGQVLVHDATFAEPFEKSKLELTLLDVPSKQTKVIANNVVGQHLSVDNKSVVYTSWENGTYFYKVIDLLSKQIRVVYSDTRDDNQKPDDFPAAIFLDDNFLWLYYGPPNIRGRMIRIKDGKRIDITHGFWDHDQDSMIYLVTQHNSSHLERMYFDTGKIESLLTLTEKESEIDLVQLSPDKTLFMVSPKSPDLLFLIDTTTFKKYDIKLKGTLAVMAMYIGTTRGIYSHVEYGLAWSSDNSMLAFIDSQPSVAALVVVSRDGTELLRVPVSTTDQTVSYILKWISCN